MSIAARVDRADLAQQLGGGDGGAHGELEQAGRQRRNAGHGREGLDVLGGCLVKFIDTSGSTVTPANLKWWVSPVG